MRRQYLGSTRLRMIVDKLVLLHFQLGSVSAVCDKLNKHSKTKIYPNRIHTMLSGSEVASFNLASVNAIEAAANQIETPSAQEAAKGVLAVREKTSKYPFLSLKELAKKTERPVSVLKKAVEEDNSPLTLLNRLIKELVEMKGETLIKQRKEMLPLLEMLVETGGNYIKMLRALSDD